MGTKKVEKIWVDGELIAWDAAQDHMLAHTLHYGLGAFEGIRCYERSDGRLAIFQLAAHIDRLFESCHIGTIEIPFTRAQLRSACVEVIKANRLRSCYLRPLVYLGAGALGLGSLEPPTRTLVAAFEWGAYLGEEGLAEGIRCKVSSYRRGTIDSVVSKGKLCGQYVTSILAKRDAIKRGFDEAIMLDHEGRVAEGTGENIFLVKNGIVYTPPTWMSILPGITRASVIALLREAGHEVREEPFTRDQMWVADELFLTGTAAEVTPVREVDDRKIGAGSMGPLTRSIQARFFDVVRGSGDAPHSDWLTFLD